MDSIAEVSSPLPACSDKLSLGFNGRSLAFSIPGKAFQYAAVSGKLHGDFSVAAQKDRNLGPIPAVSYWIDPAQLWTAGPILELKTALSGLPACSIPLTVTYP